MEEKKIMILTDEKILKEGYLEIWEECPDDEEFVMLKLYCEGICYESKSDNFFSALIDIRKKLEKEGLQILCNGAAINVYPSNMQLSMGTCSKAYKMRLYKSAITNDLVDIFDFDNTLSFVSIDEQLAFYQKWMDSILRDK